MDDAEVVQASAEGAMTSVLKPLVEFLAKLLGPAADQTGLILGDQFRFIRWEWNLKGRVRILAKAKEILEATNQKPDEVPLKLLLPILENGSIEEDEYLQGKWAALLANSCGGHVIITGAPEILKQLNSYQVRFLQMCFDYACTGVPIPERALDSKPLNETYHQWFALEREKHGFWMSGMEDHRYAGIMMLDLKRLGLVMGELAGEASFYMTQLGYEFVFLCQDWSERAKAKSRAA